MIISYKRLKETAWVLSPVSHTLHRSVSGWWKECRDAKRKRKTRGQADSDGVKRDGGCMGQS